jgi:hypothetical protein
MTEHPEAKISTVRDYVKTLPYEAQRQFSINMVRQAMNNAEVNDRDRSTIEREIQNLENPTLCPPDRSQTKRSDPSIGDVQAALERLRDDGKRLPDAQSVAPWSGKNSSGTFVDLGDGIVAQHIGRGSYAIMDVQQDLRGVQPPSGQYAELSANGQFQIPQQGQAPFFGRG